MSIEKLDFIKVTKEHRPYTTFLNQVVQSLRWSEALAVWVYLSSLPPAWNVNKDHLEKHFGLGERKLRDIMSYLRKANLIEYRQGKFDNGHWGKSVIHVLSGENFIIPKDNVLNVKENTGKAIPAPVDNTGEAISAPPVLTGEAITVQPVYRPTRYDAHINTTMLIKEKREQRGAVPVDNFVEQVLIKSTVQKKQKPSLFFFEPSEAALEAAAAKRVDVKALREKFIRHYSGENEFARNWPELFHNWILSEKVNKAPLKSDATFADVTKQSTSAGYMPCESPEESQRKWEERMREYGRPTFGAQHSA